MIASDPREFLRIQGKSEERDVSHLQNVSSSRIAKFRYKHATRRTSKWNFT